MKNIFFKLHEIHTKSFSAWLAIISVLVIIRPPTSNQNHRVNWGACFVSLNDVKASDFQFIF